MTAAVQQLLETFDQLPEEDQLTAAAAILRRSLNQPLSAVDDEALCILADELFQTLDAEEAKLGDGPTAAE